MNRHDIIEFVRRDICPQISLGKVGATAFFSFRFKDTVLMIESWRRHHNFPQHLTAKVEDGFLFINGEPAGRIIAVPHLIAGGMYASPAVDGPDHENMILAAQESDYD